MEAAAFAGFAEDARNSLALVKVAPGKPLRYLAGAGWDRARHYPDQASWLAYVASESARARSPITVTLSTKQP
jgi:hypothetical protein